MTSMEFFNHPPLSPAVPPEWGTGRMKNSNVANLWIPRAPTWHYSGHPINQDYTLTQLKLSNVRLNDQLLNNPQHEDISKRMIDLPYPSEHPYASHQPRKAIFPTFDSPYDPKRGVKAQERPLNDEIPSQPHQVVVISKTQGNPYRHELQQFDTSSQRQPLTWLENGFDQVVKGEGHDKNQFYPTPPKMLAPNLELRDNSKVLKGDMELSERTATALRNVERQQWKTTYDLNHTGLGPSAPLALDNYEAKRKLETATGLSNQQIDQLMPRSVRTFDPPRPKEGRLARSLSEMPPPQTATYPVHQSPSHKRSMTLTEREEHRLLYGKEYVNLPGGHIQDGDWREFEDTIHDEYGLELLRQKQAEGQATPVPYQPAGSPELGSDASHGKADVIQAHKDSIQQMESGNRWRFLESEGPNHDIEVLRHKLASAPDNEQPKIFYTHEGKFQTERSGLYKTTYDPYKLQYSMNTLENSGGYKFDTTTNHLGVYQGVFQPFDSLKDHQKGMIQPKVATADPRTQEGHWINKESETGESYNTKLFLQEHELNELTRTDPRAVLSAENHDLARVRSQSRNRSQRPGQKKVHFHLDLNTRQSSSPAISTARFTPTSLSKSLNLPTPLEESRNYTSINSGFHSARTPVTRYDTDLFASKSFHIMAPSDVTIGSQYRTSYQNQYPTTARPDLGYKHDPRFEWKVGSGPPRPQTVLLDLQNSFVKTDVRKKFLAQFPEKNPDLRENIIRGKKHDFAGFNAQALRGAVLTEE